MVASLKRDYLFVDEIDAWQGILKWGLARHPNIRNINNVENWTKQNFVDLGNTLKELILLIRFKDISNKDFRYKIKPYQKLIPKSLREKLLDYYLFPDNESSLALSPSRITRIDSTIITNKNIIFLFSNWIDKSYNSISKIKYS